MTNEAASEGAVPRPDLKKVDGHVHLPQNPLASRQGIRLNSSVTAGLQPAVFLDRDGVLVEDVGFLGKPAGIRILPGVAQALRSLASRFRLVVVTNQSGIARGLFNEDDLLAIHRELSGRLAEQGAVLDAYYYCPHLPEGSVPAYSLYCECRKPKPGMLRQASSDMGIPLSESYMIGDKPRDVLAGLAVGAKGIMLGSGENGCPDSAIVAGSLLEAAKLILNQVQLTANSRTRDPHSSPASAPTMTAPRQLL